MFRACAFFSALYNFNLFVYLYFLSHSISRTIGQKKENTLIYQELISSVVTGEKRTLAYRVNFMVLVQSLFIISSFMGKN